MFDLQKHIKPVEQNSSSNNVMFFQCKQASIKCDDHKEEQQANAMADHVMRSSTPQQPFFSPSFIQRKENSGASSQINNHSLTLAGGNPLGKEERNFFESRMGYDFSNVRLHNDNAADKSARSINALAYTTGNDIIFRSNQYQPDSGEGKKLLAHELTHVIQQNTGATENKIQRYSDQDHHILEEVALSDVFSEEELKQIEHGNTQRDYSQLPAVGSALLIGEPNLGGYKGHQHFDNFIFDREKNRWVSHTEYNKIWDDAIKEWVNRPVPLKAKGSPKMTPEEYIESEFKKAVEKDVPDAAAFMHVGNAFHTIEDFFAHSNFIELTKGDYSSGKELTTHPPGAHGAASIDSILANVLDPVPASVYKQKFMKGYEEGSAVSHGKMSKDFHINPNHLAAMTLSALVIRQTGMMIKNAFAIKTKEKRNEYVQTVIMATLLSYLRPPDEKNKWWEGLLEKDTGRTERKIKEMEEKTPVTINQTPGSPLRNLEATKFSSWKAIGLGTSISVPLKDRTFFTAGYMLYAPGTGVSVDDKIFVAPRTEWKESEKPAIIFGAQISGTFDLTDLLTGRK